MRHLRLNLRVMARLLRVSAAGILQFAIANASWIVLVRIVSLFGATAVAGYTVSIRIVVFFILPAWGLSNAAATLVGQNLGAGEPGRAEQAVWRTGFYNMVFLGVIGIFFIVFAGPVVRLFISDPAVIPIAVLALRTLSCGNIGYTYGMVMLQAYNGAGDTFTPTVVNFFGFWVLELPLAWWLAVGLRLHAEGTFLSIVISECAIAGASIVLFRRGRWQETENMMQSLPPFPGRAKWEARPERKLGKETCLLSRTLQASDSSETIDDSESYEHIRPPAAGNPGLLHDPGLGRRGNDGSRTDSEPDLRHQRVLRQPHRPPASGETLKLTLDDAIRLGLQNNLGLKEAESGEKSIQGAEERGAAGVPAHPSLLRAPPASTSTIWPRRGLDPASLQNLHRRFQAVCPQGFL